MPVTPTSNLTKSIDALRTLIANTLAFQAWVEAINPAAAKTRIDIVEGTLSAFPRARVSTGGDRNEAAVSRIAAGTLRVTFADTFDDTDTKEDAEYLLLNSVGDIVTEMVDVSRAGNVADVLFVRSIDQDGAVHWPDQVDDDAAQILEAVFTVSWGLEGVSEGS